jgi:hypothetical protein
LRKYEVAKGLKKEFLKIDSENVFSNGIQTS